MKKLALSVLVLSSVFFSSCEEAEKIEQHAHLSLKVEHKVDSNILAFDTLIYVNSVGHKYEVQTLKYFVSNILLHKSGGKVITIKGPFYIDAEDESTFELDHHTDLSPGEYEKITLTFGLDSALNISNSLTNAKEVGMAWPGGGYHYMKLEGTYKPLDTSITKSFLIHTGATMGNPYHIDIEIPNSNFTISDQDISIKISMNINEWFNNPYNYDFSDYPTGIMSKMDAQLTLKTNGSSVFTATIN
jgi:hypothetical protein